jgi:hypothetical protein
MFIMGVKNEIKLFEEKQVRSIWDAEKEKWYISVVDIITVLTESMDPNAYWRKLKQRLKEEGNETVTNCHGLKMLAQDGKMRVTDVADTEQIFRLIQSIPSPKAEPFKIWLAQVAAERLDEMQDPELSIDRALEQYVKLGYSEKWINQRIKSIEIRKEPIDRSFYSTMLVLVYQNLYAVDHRLYEEYRALDSTVYYFPFLSMPIYKGKCI